MDVPTLNSLDKRAILAAVESQLGAGAPFEVTEHAILEVETALDGPWGGSRSRCGCRPGGWVFPTSLVGTWLDQG